MCIYIYICVCVCIYVYIYIYTYTYKLICKGAKGVTRNGGRKQEPV